jgi:nitroreductase
LAAPGPDPATLQRMLATAVRVPDHGKRVPFRFVRIAGDARTALADAAQARLLEREPDAGDAVVAKLRTRTRHTGLNVRPGRFAQGGSCPREPHR